MSRGSSGTSGRTGRALVLATALALLAVLPALVSLRSMPDFPVRAFTVDDGLYLQRAIQAWQGLHPYRWAYAENAGPMPLAEVALVRPNAVTDIAVGALAHGLGLGPAGLAIVLDLACGATSLFLLAAIFGCWTGPGLAMTAAVLAVCFPGALVPDPLWNLPHPVLPGLVNQPFLDHASPAFRAVYTQASYPLFLGVVLLLLRGCFTGAAGFGRFAWIGILGGLAGHGYFFPWVVCLLLGLAMPLVAATLAPRLALAGALARSASFLAGWIVGSAGSFVVLALQQTEGIVADEVIGAWWFFPAERLVVAAGLLLAAFVRRGADPRRAGLAAFIGLLLVLELPLMNLQPLLRQGLAPYHFPSFYLHPLAAGAAFVLLVDWLRSGPGLQLLARAAAALPVAALAFTSLLGVKAALSPATYDSDLGWLVRRLKATEPGSVFALSGVTRPFSVTPPERLPYQNLPNFASMLSGRPTLQQEWMFDRMDEDADLRRELGMAWLLSGAMQPLWAAPDPVELPGDLFTLTTTVLQLRRRQKMQRHGALLSAYNPCDFLRDFRVDYLVHDTTNEGPLEAAADRFLEFEAASPNDHFRLFRFDRARARAALCGLPAGTLPRGAGRDAGAEPPP